MHWLFQLRKTVCGVADSLRTLTGQSMASRASRVFAPGAVKPTSVASECQDALLWATCKLRR